jgi:hypothetical protein
MHVGNLPRAGCDRYPSIGLTRGGQLGKSPHEAHQFTGNGHHDLIRVFASCPQLSIALTPSPWRFPAEVLDGFGWLFEPQVSMPPDVSRVARGLGPFDQGPTGMGIPGCGQGPLPASLATGVFRGDQPPAFHELRGIVAARQVPHLRDGGDRPRALPAA